MGLNTSGLGQKRRRLLLLLLQHGFSLTRACDTVGLHRRQVLRWRNADRQFASELKMAHAEGQSIRDLAGVVEAIRNDDMKLFVTNAGRHEVDPATGKRVRNIQPSGDVAGELVNTLAKLTRRIEKLARQQAEAEDDPAIAAMTEFSGPNAIVNALREKFSERDQEQDQRRKTKSQKRRDDDDAVAAMTEFTSPDAVQRELQRQRNKRG